MVTQMLKRWLRRLRPTTQAPTLSSLDAYDRWVHTYPPKAHNALMEVEQAAMLDLLPGLEGQTILDLAGGTGRYGLIAQERGAKQILCLDYSPAMLAANALANRAVATTEALPLPTTSIDGVICALALGHLPQLEPSMREIGRVLRPGGWALISDLHPFRFLTGAQRTFNAGRETFAVEHYTHLYSDYHRAAQMANLTIEQVAEPHFAAGGNLPVLLVYRLRRINA